MPALPASSSPASSQDASGFADAEATWNRRFNRPDYIFGTTPNAYLARQAERLHGGQRALVVADGEGRNSVWLAQQGLTVEAFDISPVGVGKARRLARRAQVKVSYRVASCENWEWKPERYDVVVAVFIQFAPPALRERIFKGMLAALKPGGLLVLQGYGLDQLKWNTGGPRIAEHLYTEDMLRAAFAGHELMELEIYEAELREGSQHVGRSALVGALVRKQPATATV